MANIMIFQKTHINKNPKVLNNPNNLNDLKDLYDLNDFKDPSLPTPPPPDGFRRTPIYTPDIPHPQSNRLHHIILQNKFGN